MASPILLLLGFPAMVGLQSPTGVKINPSFLAFVSYFVQAARQVSYTLGSVSFGVGALECLICVLTYYVSLRYFLKNSSG